jgi:uncharacterized protein (DUF362 family)
MLPDSLNSHRVALLRTPSPRYEDLSVEDILSTLERGAVALGWSPGSGGAFTQAIPAKSQIVVKPNFVLHKNLGSWGPDPLFTHSLIVKAVTEAALLAAPSCLLIGDAPIQSCDFDALLQMNGLPEWAHELGLIYPSFQGIRDFRRTICSYENGRRVATENLLPEADFVLFDLGSSSLLEPVTNADDRFRVTCYDPRILAQRHRRGVHQYLIAKPVLEADVVLNLPKLKMHKKAGITGALKNLVGINGNKEFLPHHRLGGSSSNGDCYPGFHPLKRLLEFTLDRQNIKNSNTPDSAWRFLTRTLSQLISIMGDRIGVEGSWSGNDTVWRMALDLNRILLYGRPDGTMADSPQRLILSVIDAIVAGQGEGPLAPEPLPLSLLLMGANPAALDWVGAALLGFNPNAVPLTLSAFRMSQWPLTNFSPDSIEVVGDYGTLGLPDLLDSMSVTDRIFPAGWKAAARGGSRGTYRESSLCSASE